MCCPPQVTNVNNDKVNALIVSNIKAGRRYGVYFADLIKMSEFVYASNMLVAGAPCNYSELLRLVSLGKCNPKTHGASPGDVPPCMCTTVMEHVMACRRSF